jgi:hypothetical protein
MMVPVALAEALLACDHHCDAFENKKAGDFSPAIQ